MCRMIEPHTNEFHAHLVCGLSHKPAHAVGRSSLLLQCSNQCARLRNSFCVDNSKQATANVLWTSLPGGDFKTPSELKMGKWWVGSTGPVPFGPTKLLLPTTAQLIRQPNSGRV